jgi:hypothetical protein
MTDIEAKALALPDRLRIIPDANGMMYDDYDDVMEAADLIEQHEAFKQKVSDTLQEYTECFNPPSWHRIDQFIIPKPKPDPLVEVLEEISGEGGFDNFDHYAYNLHAALEARGFEIREKSK